MDIWLKKSVKLTVILSGLITITFVLLHRFFWAGGFLLASLLALANFVLTINILQTAVLSKSRKRLALLFLVKFPILYLVGFLILVSRRFPPGSLLSGLIVMLAVAGATKIWPKLI